MNLKKYLHLPTFENNRFEKVIVGSVFLVLLLLVTGIRFSHWHLRPGDTAFLSEIMTNVSHTGKADTKVNAAVHNAYPHWGETHENICLNSKNTKESRSILNQFTKHAYFILYLFAPINWVIPVKYLLPFLTSLSFLSILLISYIFLRKSKLNILSAGLVTTLISFHPNWSSPVLNGQAYADRFFIPLALSLFLYMSTNIKKMNLKLVMVLAFICCLTIERSGFIIFAFTSAFTVLHWKLLSKEARAKLSITALMSIFYSMFVMKVFLINDENDSFKSSMHPSSVIAYLSSDRGFNMLLIFVTINLLIYGVLTVFNWRGFVISLCSMLPNIMGNVGGAEKVGWATHYHSMYFPVLVWAILLGSIKIYELTNNRKKLRFSYYISLALLCLTIGKLNIYSFDDPKTLISTKNMRSNNYLHQMNDLYKDFFKQKENSLLRKKIEFHNQIKTQIPKGSTITSIEGGLIPLYEDNNLNFFPLGIEEADYAIVNYRTLSSGKLRFYGTPFSAGGAKEREILEQCIEKRMIDNGFDLEKPALIIRPLGIAILKK